MPRMFPVEVRLFVVEKKKEGHSWDRVIELVREQFKIDPPSRRQMVKWLKTTDRPAINNALEQKAKKELDAKKGQAIAMAMDDLLPDYGRPEMRGKILNIAAGAGFLVFRRMSWEVNNSGNFLKDIKMNGRDNPNTHQHHLHGAKKHRIHQTNRIRQQG